MATRVNDAVHVEIEIVEFDVVGIGFGAVDRHFDTIYDLLLLLHAMDHDRRELPAQPTEKCRDSHD